MGLKNQTTVLVCREQNRGSNSIGIGVRFLLEYAEERSGNTSERTRFSELTRITPIIPEHDRGPRPPLGGPFGADQRTASQQFVEWRPVSNK